MSLGGMSIEKPQKPTTTENHHVFGAGHVGPLCSTPARSRSLHSLKLPCLIFAPERSPRLEENIYTKHPFFGSSMWVFWGVGQFSSIVYIFSTSKFFSRGPTCHQNFEGRMRVLQFPGSITQKYLMCVSTQQCLLFKLKHVGWTFGTSLDRHHPGNLNGS